MSAYEIRLDYEEVITAPPSASIVAHDPFAGYEVPISPSCVSYVEIRHEVKRLKKALDVIDVEARRRFRAHAKKVAKR